MIIHDEMEQGSEEWLSARLGIPTASEFGKILTPSTLRPSKQAMDYMRLKAAEVVRGKGDEDAWAGNAYTEAGHTKENDAREIHAFAAEKEVEQVGFITDDDGRYGCSPDGIVRTEIKFGRVVGGVEIKCPAPKKHVEYYLSKDRVPIGYRMQLVGTMWITGAEWWDFVSYCPGMPIKNSRIEREEVAKDIDALRAAVEEFCEDLDKMVKRIKAV